MSLLNKIQKPLLIASTSALLLGTTAVVYFGAQHTKAQDDLISSSNIF